MRPLRILAVAVTLAVANCLPGALRAQEQQPSSESMAAAQALFALLFTHGFATLNAQAVEAAWPGIESALRTQRPNIDPATLADLRREFERIRLARLSEVVKDIPAIYARHLNAEDMRVLAPSMAPRPERRCCRRCQRSCRKHSPACCRACSP